MIYSSTKIIITAETDLTIFLDSLGVSAKLLLTYSMMSDRIHCDIRRIALNVVWTQHLVMNIDGEGLEYRQINVFALIPALD